VRFFETMRPDVVGISAVVSTAYAYVKQLSSMLRAVLPSTRVVLGGNLAASAEILLRKCAIDVCVTAEGEIPLLNLIRCYSENPRLSSEALGHIKGIVFLDEAGEVCFTGYEPQIPAAELSDPDFSILEQYSNIAGFIQDPMTKEAFEQDPRSYEAHRKGKRMATVVATKGCVARCTFCHRWDKGFRQLPVEKIIGRFRYLMDRYNVGFVLFGDENFGSDRRALDQLLPALKELDVLWSVGGMRARSVDLDLLRRMKAAGCVAVYYGTESGSQKILDVMEKNTTVQQNLNALEWTREAGLFTIIQLVLGMPGETRETVHETAEFMKRVTGPVAVPPHLSINYTQALPGTPVYEYARQKGLIGPTLDDEEKYLIQISDTNAGDDTKFLNYTDQPMLEVITWRPTIVLEATQHWYTEGAGRTRPHVVIGVPQILVRVLRSGAAFLLSALLPGHWRFRSALLTWLARGRLRRQQLSALKEDSSQGGYFNIHESIFRNRLSPTAYAMRRLLLRLWSVWHVLWEVPRAEGVAIIVEWLRRMVRPPAIRPEEHAVSLRRTVRQALAPAVTVSEISMRPLREGR
jgi:radical SAM superfamily enzyme YgiQ (UPF0313 family)